MRTAAQEHDNIHVEVCYSRPTENCRKGYDYQHEGFVSVELMRSLLPSSTYEFYVCCPPQMMETITRDLADWGVPEANIHFEAFGPATVKKALAKPKPSETAKGVEVTFVRSRKVVQWRPETGSILDCAEANGVFMDSGCRAGNCGTCLTAIKEGKVSYLTPPGSEPEEGSCLACIAVPDGPLVLDY
jgi:ferredoxin